MSGWDRLPEYIIEPARCETCRNELWTGVGGHERNGTTKCAPQRIALVIETEPTPDPNTSLGYVAWCPLCQPIENGRWNVWVSAARNRAGEWRMWQRPGTVMTESQMLALVEGIRWLGNCLDRIREERAENGRGPWALERRDGEVWIPWDRGDLSRRGRALQLRAGRIQHAARPCYACDIVVESGLVWRPAQTSGWCGWHSVDLAKIIVCNPCYLAAREPETAKVVESGTHRVVVIEGGRSRTSP